MKLRVRPVVETARRALLVAGLHPVLARVLAARGVSKAEELARDAAKLIPPSGLLNVDRAATLLANAIAAKKRILIVADYDADGATACAVGIRALSSMGGIVDYLVPDRFKLGYGLSPELVDLAAQRMPDLLVTVDNGIASVDGVARAKELGIATLITDHHLPGPELPAADCIVNPNQPGCPFPSKSLAGVGVMFYVMLALRAELRRRGVLPADGGPNLAALTDLVALGTVADVASLDANNRLLVAQGLKRLRSGKGQPGLNALLRVAGRHHASAGAFDLGFAAGPRLNAAGRLEDMSVGIECLITDDEARAANLAQRLDELNRQRRGIERGMLDQAIATLPEVRADEGSAAVFYRPDWHQGVVGILASRLREQLHRPVVCFARADATADDGWLRGSGRSIPGFHLRDALDLVSKREPGLIVRFGGHAQAAGLTLREQDLPRFEAAFLAVAAETMPPEALAASLDTDGELEADYYTLEVAQMLENEIWGQNFPPPVFCDTFDLERQRVVGERHLKLNLVRGGRRVDAIWFNALGGANADSLRLSPRIRAAYRLTANEYNGIKSVQLNIEHVEN